MNIVILGLSITSSWGNGHATTYRSLVKGLFKRGHTVHFLERDVPWYANQRDAKRFDYCKVSLYNSLSELQINYKQEIQNADLVIVGSYVPEGVEAGKWVLRNAGGITAFYDIDTPVTLSKLKKGEYEYIHPELIPQYDLYLSFSGGRVLEIFTLEYGSPGAVPLYCSVDAEIYYPESVPKKWDIGYLGTYSDDRQPPLEKLLIEPAVKWTEGRFVVAGPQYPETIVWPANVVRIEHLPPARHRRFYNEQRFTLNITRNDMIKMGHSPSVRLFEAAACGVPVISDYWEGLEDFFKAGSQIYIAKSPGDTLKYLQQISEQERMQVGQNARTIVLEKHTGEKRAKELEKYVLQLRKKDLLI